MEWVGGLAATILAVLAVSTGVIGQMVLVNSVAEDRLPRGLRWITRSLVPRLGRLFPTLVPTPGRVADPVSPVLLGLELRRLGHVVTSIEVGNPPAKAARLAAGRAAYDRVLLDYCEAMGIPVPGDRVPLSQDARFRAESALIGAGADW